MVCLMRVPVAVLHSGFNCDLLGIFAFFRIDTAETGMTPSIHDSGVEVLICFNHG